MKSKVPKAIKVLDKKNELDKLKEALELVQNLEIYLQNRIFELETGTKPKYQSIHCIRSDKA
ncbi:MAG: hypothetical protein HYV97_03690 [Bdellovibrio sp.]|nr:hypothetical protein [Bdellovibrio sp.]